MFDFIQTIDFYVILQIYQAGGFFIFDQLAILLSFFGTVRFGAILLSLIFWMKKETRPIAVVLISAVLLSGILTGIIKEIADRPRPYIELGLTAADMLVPTDPTVSFPSGHTTTAFATATVVSYYFRKWAAPAFLLACIAGLARIYLTVHYPSDVFAGAMVGILSALFVIYVAKKYASKKSIKENEKTGEMSEMVESIETTEMDETTGTVELIETTEMVETTRTSGSIETTGTVEMTEPIEMIETKPADDK